MSRIRRFVAVVFLGSLASLIACGSGSADEAANSEQATDAVAASSQTRAEIGVDGWSLEVEAGSTKIEGRTQGQEVVARFQAAIAKDPATGAPIETFVVSRGASVAVLALSRNGDDIEIRESSFDARPELARVLELLRGDLASVEGGDGVGTRVFGALQPQKKLVNDERKVPLVACADSKNAYANAKVRQADACKSQGQGCREATTAASNACIDVHQCTTGNTYPDEGKCPGGGMVR